MASSQEIAKWVERHLQSTEWLALREAMAQAIGRAMPKASIEIQTDLAEEHLKYVDEILRNNRALLIEDGGVPTYELDEKDQYIRRVNQLNVDVAAKLRKIDPFYFEVVCKRILEEMGGAAENTQKSYDNGVDFYALNLTTYAAGYPVPKSAALTVIGQAKRYGDNNDVTETEIRKFVGGAAFTLDQLRKQGKVNVCSPVVFAFWTTSDLHLHAKEYSRKMGIWHLDGIALAEYVVKLGLINEIFPGENP
jgi:restriction endonuclease Mrr